MNVSRPLVALLTGIFFSQIGFAAASAPSAPSSGGGGGKFFRVDATLGLVGALPSFDETVSSKVYTNSLAQYGGDLGFHLGIRISAVSLGIVGSGSVLSGSGSKTLNSKPSGADYQYQMAQALGGGFVAVSLNGSADGPEIIGEYYAAADSSVNYSDASDNNPLRKGDDMGGKGWGAGMSFTFKPTVRFGLMYRDILYDRLNFSGTANTTDRTTIDQKSAMLLILHSY